MNNSLGNKSFTGIDLTKFICSILVVMIHIPPFGINASSKVAINLNYIVHNYIARLAVPFFFMTSSYFFFKKTTYEDFDVDILKKIVIKFLKLYIVWSIIYFPFALKVSINKFGWGITTIVYIIRNMVFVGTYDHLWYIHGTIISFYLFLI